MRTAAAEVMQVKQIRRPATLKAVAATEQVWRLATRKAAATTEQVRRPTAKPAAATKSLRRPHLTIMTSSYGPGEQPAKARWYRPSWI